ncbi:TonB-dependent receptor [Novosphingobium cyanobacteriorum]|uniref:TonB-dependent receptor n=1 Tax=Novosphingobium cyanobacteriorum TaxID=3024215 RepID=A0ABT6CKE5_9SPHN|nr:TonB-dependent receptor [Novosphingobium cyanobacteriorum]MDF8333738.1 TonB-dependent receptor [Novosphingobium cyanobacteriorum]
MGKSAANRSTSRIARLASAAWIALAPAVLHAEDASDDGAPRQIVVTASRLDLIGVATTSSEGEITRQEIAQRPAYRVGQYLESIPGLAVTSHSGEGKANQYLLRGFNLDHGTDFATWVDGMPVNQRTHAHGQGYTDLNFLLPELIGGIAFTKGAYFASEGDFSAVGTAHLALRDTMPFTISVGAGTVGDRRLFAGGSLALSGGGALLGAVEHFQLDGPWDNPDRLRRINAVLRWSAGTAANGFSLTAMAYDGHWNATTDQPLRAITAGLIGRFGSLDPSDGGRASRYSLSFRFSREIGDCDLEATAFGIRQHLTLWSNFTHFLDNPIRGDQHAQNDGRWIGGGSASLRVPFTGLGAEHALTFGAQARTDVIDVDLASTERRTVFAVDRDNRVDELSLSAYAEHRAKWASWLRTVVGLRIDHFRTTDHDRLSGIVGRQGASLFQPKVSIVLAPWPHTEFTISAGRGFHSNDARAGLEDDGQGGTSLVRPPLLVESNSYEAGLRTNVVPHLTLTATAFQADFASELTYSADAGQTEAGRPSRRRGLEFTAQYRPAPWLEINGNLAFSHARYRDGPLANRFIEDAPGFIGSAGILVDGFGPWSGSLVWRRLGPHPLVDDNSVRSSGYGQVNLALARTIGKRFTLRAEVFNLLGSTSDAADYFYRSRLKGEDPGGIEGLNVHALEPRSLRISLSASL